MIAPGKTVGIGMAVYDRVWLGVTVSNAEQYALTRDLARCQFNMVYSQS